MNRLTSIDPDPVFTVRPLEFSRTAPGLAVEVSLRTPSRNGSAATAEMIGEVENGRGFLLGGARGCGKTSLLNEVSFHFNWQVDNVVVLGPLSLSLVAQKGLNSLGSQLRDWLQDNQTRISYTLSSSSQPSDADSLDAWLPFLNGLISQRNAKTLLLLLDDLDSVPLEDREAVLRDIQDSSWAKLATRTVLGCAGNLLEGQTSQVTGDETHAGGRTGSQAALPVILKRKTAVDLLSALTVNLGSVPESTKKGMGKEGGGKGAGTYEGMVRGGKPPRHRNGEYLDQAEGGEKVDCTVYAPGEASPENSFLVQVFAHLAEQATALEDVARAAEPDAKKRIFGTLQKKIERGSELMFCLTMPGLEIDEPKQTCIWRGQPASIQFGVTVPKNSKTRDLLGTVEVCESSVPIGHLKFKFKIVAEAATPSIETVPAGNLVRYKQAFISYASRDRSEVLKRIQMLDAGGPRYFMDQVDIKPGARWEKLIYKYLDESDVVFLFWSKAARRSRWVRKEIEYAKKRQAGNDAAPPEIVPIIIEGPPAVKAPAELDYLQFNDKFIYFINPKEAGG